jgi:hypothetical protein
MRVCWTGAVATDKDLLKAGPGKHTTTENKGVILCACASFSNMSAPTYHLLNRNITVVKIRLETSLTNSFN